MVLHKKTLLNFMFVLWLISELFFQYTFISQVALILFCIVMVVCIQKIRFNALCVGLFLFIVCSVVNIATGKSIDVSTSWSMTVTIMINFVFLLLFAQYYRYIGDIKVILKLFSAVVLVFSVVCMLVGFSSVITFGRMHINGVNANTAAYYVVFASVWSFYLVVFEQKVTYGNIFSLLVYILFIIMTGSRGAFFALLIGMYLLFIVYNKKIMTVKVIVATLSIALILVLVLKVDVLYNLIGYRIEPLLKRVVDGSYEEASMISRMKYSALAFSKVNESLFLGHGLDCFRYLNGAYGTYSHNNYAEILFSLGVSGFVFYYFPYIWNVKYYLVSILEKNNEAVVASVFILVYLISEPFRVTYFNRAFLILPLICYLYMSDEKRKTCYLN